MNENSQNEKSQNEFYEGSWFLENGPENDVVIFTQILLFRNLDDFLFSSNLDVEDKDRINYLVYDALSDYKKLRMITTIDSNIFALNILKERFFPFCTIPTLIFLDSFAKNLVIVNSDEHIKIVSFAPGFNCDLVMKNAYEIDEILQNKLQFAASVEFGYLCEQIQYTGTAMKFSALLCLPATVLSGKIYEIKEFCKNKNFLFYEKFSFSEEDSKDKNQGEFKKFYFTIEPQSCFCGNEIDQAVEFNSIVQFITKNERKIRTEFVDNKRTVATDFVRRAWVKGLSFEFLMAAETTEIIAIIKFGLECKILSGITHGELLTLLVLMQPTHVEYFLENRDFSFEEEIKKNKFLQENKIRAAIVQNFLKNLKFNS